MKESLAETFDQPVWARVDAFSRAPDGWGWTTLKGKRVPCDSLESLITAIREDRNGDVALVWSPAHSHMVLPEELAGADLALRDAREIWTRDDLSDATGKLRWFGGILVFFSAYTFYAGYQNSAATIAAQTGLSPTGFERVKFAIRTIFDSTGIGLALLMFLILAFIPWYQARKRRAELTSSNTASETDIIPALRFETWLTQQKSPFTKGLLVMMGLVALGQIFAAPSSSPMALFYNWHGAIEAGLVKPLYFKGEWWRLFTAPFLHGNLVHFLMNASALAYLGKRLEVFARWPHVPLVFLFSACIGGEASARFLATTSVGASGGLMGWLGFLLVFETLHKRLVPQSARRRLAAGVVLTAIIGLVGYKFVDNAAHAGGLLAGMLYAAIVFPASSSPIRPRSTKTDLIAGTLATCAIIAFALLALRLLI